MIRKRSHPSFIMTKNKQIRKLFVVNAPGACTLADALFLSAAQLLTAYRDLRAGLMSEISGNFFQPNANLVDMLNLSIKY